MFCFGGGIPTKHGLHGSVEALNVAFPIGLGPYELRGFSKNALESQPLPLKQPFRWCFEDLAVKYPEIGQACTAIHAQQLGLVARLGASCSKDQGSFRTQAIHDTGARELVWSLERVPV